MNIAYSCAGEGFGHAARMVALYEDLSERHTISLFVPETVNSFVKQKIELNSRPSFGKPNINSVPCFALTKQGNSINYVSTAAAGIATLLSFPSELSRLAQILKYNKTDVVLSDFEPFLPLAARLAGIPIVQMNHPGIVDRFVEPDPYSWTASMVASFMQGPWDKRVLVSFYEGDVGPVLRSSLSNKKIEDRGFLAVNLKESARPLLLPALNGLQHVPYRLFPSQGANFDEALATCSAVIAGAGHQTISEALVLGKPVLAIPQDGQYEQLLNARMLERSGRGTWCTSQNFASALPRFLDKLDGFRKAPILKQGFTFTNSRQTLIDTLEFHFATLTRCTPNPAAFTAVQFPSLSGSSEESA